MAGETHTGSELAGQVVRWRLQLEVLGLAIAVTSLTIAFGMVVSEFDPLITKQSPAFAAWDRVRVLGNIAAGPTLTVAAGIALALVLILRVLFRWPPGTPSGVARATVLVVMVTAVWQAVARGLYLASATFANHSGWLGGYSGFEQFEIIMAAVGTWLGSGALIYIGVRGLALLRHDPEPPSGEVAELA